MDGLLWSRIGALRGRLPRTETVQFRHSRIRLFAKMESANPSGSAKDRAAYWILREAIRRGDITRATTVVESSSGNFALSLAMFCKLLGVRFIPVLDPNVNKATEKILRQSCERVEKVKQPDKAGGYLLTRLGRVSELLGEIDDAYWPDQYSNADGARGHYELTGGELVQSLSRIDYLFVGVGTGATIAGLSRRVRESCAEAAVVAVDVEGSAIFGGTPKRRLIPGMGSSLYRPPLVDDALISDVVTVSESEEVSGCLDLLRRHGVMSGGSTGSVYSAINRYFAGHTGPPPVVAFLCADRGEPYRDTIYDPGWVATNLVPTCNLAAAQQTSAHLPS
jgi:cysteine synthase A